MTIVRHLIIQAVVLAAAGCTRGADRAAARDTSAPTSRADDGAPTAAPPAALIVTARGIGPLRAGMSLADATAALGGALVVAAGADTAGCHYVAWRGGPPGVRVMVEGGRIARVDVDTAGVATATGAKVGDTEEQVQALYHGRATVSPQKYVPGHYLTVLDSADTSFALVFETADGRVTRYRAGRRPQVEYVEGCG